MEGTMSDPLNKRIAVVTGGNKGIGLEICRQLATNGVMVILTARDERRGMEAAEKLKASGLSHIIFHQLEITDPSSIAQLADFLKSQFGKLDILVNNAAILGVAVDLIDVSPVQIEEQLKGKDARQRIEWVRQHTHETYEGAKACLKTNYYGTKQVTEALLPLLQSSSSGRVVNVSSAFGQLRRFNNEKIKQELNDIDNLTEKRIDELLELFLRDFEANSMEANGWPQEFCAYKVAKAALNAYSRILAKQYPLLCINCVHPGYVQTDLTMHSGLLTPEEGASGPVKVALLPNGGPTGAYLDQTQEASFV